ncbi:MAG: alkaline phosphatase family protein, partial [Saprospiraceae bacterium]|nr:alkaline phosphatase family protein [Saprospiraceae bacterium]
GQAYWLTGLNFMTSTFYMKELPKWVEKFNAKGNVKKYLEGKWEPLLPADKYRFSDENNNYEGRLGNAKAPKFPYDLSQVLELSRNYDLIKETPFGNSLLVDIVVEAIGAESLGQDEFTDMLSVSFSSSDYIGHQYGTEAMELEDSYYRLDRDLARLFNALDEKVGKGEYLAFLTADHGAAYNPGFLNAHSIPGGTIDRDQIKEELDSLIDMSWGNSDWVEYIGSNQIFLNHSSIVQAKIKLRDAQDHAMKLLLALPNIEKVYTSYSLMTGQMTEDMGERVQKGFNQKWGGDLVYLLKPHYFSGRVLGTTHGSGYTYDTHVPLLWMGWNIPNGESWKKVNITDIVPTISSLINVNRPSGAFGDIIEMKP